jgi:hypothetical protein
MRAYLLASATASVLMLSAGPALAQAANPDQPSGSAPAERDHFGFLAAAKIGGLVPFDGLQPGYQFGIEAGLILPLLHHGLSVGVDVDYAQATTSGSTTDPRVANGSYDWNLNQEFFTIMPTIMWRITTLSKLIVPFVGAGPRIYMYRSTVYGQAGANNPISNTTEVSSQVGFGVPFGAEIKVGPGGFLAEFLAQWGLLEHTATGDSHAAAIGLSLGYRVAL